MERLVDRLVAGAERLLPLTAACLLLTHGRALLAAEEPAAARLLLDSLQEDTDRVLQRTVQLWTKLNKA